MKLVMKFAAILTAITPFATHAETQYAFCQATHFESRTTYIGDVMIDNDYRYREVFENHLKHNYFYDVDKLKSFYCSHKRGSAGLDSIMRDRIDQIFFWIEELNHQVQEIHAYDLNQQ